MGDRGQDRLQTLFIGNAQFADFRAAIEDLQRWTDVTTTIDVKRAHAILRTGASPAVVILAQDRRGRFAQKDVEALRAAAPLARIVVLLGSWCEGETRSGTPLVGTSRVYWHQFSARLEEHLRRQVSSWDLPATRLPLERWLQPTSEIEERATVASVGIVAYTKVDYEGLAVVCQAGQLDSVWLNQPNVPAMPYSRLDSMTAVIWSGLDLQFEQRARLAEVINDHRDLPVIAVMGFPREFERRQALEMGAAWVVGKPLEMDDLLLPLGRFLAQRRQQAA